MTCEQWHEEAKENIRLLPRYGDVPKTKGQKEADIRFIAEAMSIDNTARAASEKLVSKGFDYYVRGDIKTAMYRFNQAWLLDSTNENVWWGYGAVYFHFLDFEQSLAMYNKGLEINPLSAALLTDKATLYLSHFQESMDRPAFDIAQGLFDASYKIAPLNQNTLFKLSALHFANGDCTQARKYYDECMALGGQPVTEAYKKDIARCK